MGGVLGGLRPEQEEDKKRLRKGEMKMESASHNYIGGEGRQLWPTWMVLDGQNPPHPAH